MGDRGFQRRLVNHCGESEPGQPRLAAHKILRFLPQAVPDGIDCADHQLRWVRFHAGLGHCHLPLGETPRFNRL
jgi:hypothetical protein